MSDEPPPSRWYRVICPGPPGQVLTVTCAGVDESDALAAARATMVKLAAGRVPEFFDTDGVSFHSSTLVAVDEVAASVVLERYGVLATAVESTTTGPPVADQGAPASTWPDQDEAVRWERALEEVAAKELADRGVRKEVSVISQYGGLWCRYGRLRVQVAGPRADVRDDVELFEHVDRWVAFELLDDEAALLDRDRAYMAQWRAQLQKDRRIWEQAADVVFADVEPAVTGYQSWTIALVEDTLEQNRPRRDEDTDDLEVSHRSSMTILLTPPGWKRPEPTRRRLLLPHLALRAEADSTRLPTLSTEGIGAVAEAVAHLAEWLQESIIESTWGAWPTCPRHDHPLTVEDTTWVCPTDDRAVAQVGHLRQVAPGGDEL